MNKKVVINSCYGGFSLSEKAFVEYLKRKGINCVTEVNEFGWVEFYKNLDYVNHINSMLQILTLRKLVVTFNRIFIK